MDISLKNQPIKEEERNKMINQSSIWSFDEKDSNSLVSKVVKSHGLQTVNYKSHVSFFYCVVFGDYTSGELFLNDVIEISLIEIYFLLNVNYKNYLARATKTMKAGTIANITTISSANALIMKKIVDILYENKIQQMNRRLNECQ